ncbi:MAG TPA: S26 family signal peptidase [Gemmataceae bacterium]|jgi:signal peptidase I|nr:S26 family signal peptidase [Gemmataceae bacterium]
MADNPGRIPAHQIAVGAPPLAGPVNNSHPLTETAPARAKVPPQAPPAAEPKDSLREVVETVVFVVVLVLLLKSFVAEAFVIPTGSMAETLYGYQKWVTCPKCKFPFPVNCSSEVDPQGEPPTPVVGCTCPNCRYQIDFAQDFEDESRWPKWQTGDRVLVGKYFYDLGVEGLNSPQRYQVVVFKYPKQPQKDYTPLNYIKRMIGLPEETIAIHYGKLYRFTGLNYAEQDRGVPPDDLWKDDYMHKDDAAALRLFEQGKFEILRKGSKQVLAERRIVYDNDHQATDLKNKIDSRWQSARETREAWQLNDVAEPTVFRHAPRQGPEIAWLHYEHLMPDGNRSHARPELITDFMGYNTYEKKGQQRNAPPGNWVGDLMLECDVSIQQPQGQLIFDLSKGIDRFQARFDLASGQCSLIRITNDREQELDSKPTTITRAGKHRIRFANVDERLLVWVDNALPFAEGVNYPAPNVRGPTIEDLKPARIGVKSGGVTVSGIKLWRDTYYTANVDPARQPDHGGERVDFAQSSTWGPLEHLPVLTMYVQPNHFLCLGDNSPESSDGRSWGTVPKRLMLGRALLIYYPFFGPNRVGRIE